MCGIWARATAKRPIEFSELLFPVKMLAHRGPDSYGWFADRQVALVHTRLSIIDLSGGAQPFESFNKKYLGIVNGELYDYQIHRRRLQEQGIHFRSRSDSEVLLNLFAQEGPGALRGLSGEWAFIFYDVQKQQLHFARDPHGVKPLFYKWTAESFTLASEVKALADERPVLSEDYVKTFMARTLMPKGTSLDQCYHVLPGRLYTFDIESQKLTWQIIDPLPLGVERTLRGEEAIEATYDALKQSVRRRLVADVDVGCYLSGGVDSALTTALAVECGAKPKAFTVGFADRDFDEKDIAAKIANHLGIEHHVCQMSAKNFLPSLIQSIVAFENPVTNPHGAAKNLLSAMASQQVKVVLSGEGADEWFGGYAYLRIRKIQQFAQRHPILGKRVLDAFMAQENGRSMNHLDGRSITNKDLFEKYFYGEQPAVLGRLLKHRAYSYLTGDSLSERLDQMCAELAMMIHQDWPSYGARSSNWDLNTWFGTRVDLLHYILANVGDRQEMSHSLEGRTPFMDPQVINVAARIQENTLLKGLNEKYVLKKVAGKLFPKEIAERPKHPFFAPIKYFYLRDNQEPIRHYIDIAREGTPWLAWNRIERLLQRPPSMQAPLEGFRNSTKMLLFSLGVIIEHLRKEPPSVPRGFHMPTSVEDLLAYQMERS
jgi:asparagine synthase (glutamine-hydrolysing)